MLLSITPTFLVTTLALLGSVHAASYRPGQRFQKPTRTKTSSPRDILAARQYRHNLLRDTTTTCISVTGGVVADLAGSTDVTIRDLVVCVCSDTLDAFLTTTVGLELSAAIEASQVTSILSGLLGTEGSQCDFPTQSSRVCTAGSPCALQCTDGYTEVPPVGSDTTATCVCEEPSIVCNGVCGDFPGGCSSAGSRVRRTVPQKVTTLVQAQKLCKHKSVCGIAGREDTLEFECIDTTSALDSCGGCLVQHPFKGSPQPSVVGVDCGRLPGALTAKCSDSKCVVAKCRDGLRPSSDATQCVSPVVASRGAVPMMMNLQARGDLPVISVKPNPALQAKLGVVADAVTALVKAHQATPKPKTSSSLDVAALVQTPVDAAVQLFNANTAIGVVVKLDALISSTSNVRSKLATKSLGLNAVVATLDVLIAATVDLQTWLASNSVGDIISSAPGSSPVPLPNTSTTPINLDVASLLTGITHVVGNVDVASVALAPIIVQLTGLSNQVVDLASATSSLPNGTTTIHIPIVGTPKLPVDTSLIDAVVQAAINVDGSKKVTDLITNLDVFSTVNAAVLATLADAHDADFARLIVSLTSVGQTARDATTDITLVAHLTGPINLGLGPLVTRLSTLLRTSVAAHVPV